MSTLKMDGNLNWLNFARAIHQEMFKLDPCKLRMEKQTLKGC